jgi:hypothetical protein
VLGDKRGFNIGYRECLQTYKDVTSHSLRSIGSLTRSIISMGSMLWATRMSMKTQIIQLQDAIIGV